MNTAFRLALMIPLIVLVVWSSPVIDDHALAHASTSAGEKVIVVQNLYYALPGKADEVYGWRVHASEVRAQLGLAVGRVLRRTPSSGADAADSELPDVVWECEYLNAKAREVDLARLDASREFDPVEAHMQTLIRRFRRAVFTVSESE
jgi:hypothetical protein